MEALGNARQRDSRPLHVMAISTDPGERQTLEWVMNQLSAFEVSVSFASDPLEAATLVLSEKFDVAIGDFWLGQETIVSLIYGLREIDPRLPFLVLTNIDTNEIREIGMRAGGVSLLSKSELSPARMNEALDDLMNGGAPRDFEASMEVSQDVLEVTRMLEEVLSDLDQIHCATVLAERFIAKNSDAKARDALADAISRAYSLRASLGERLSAVRDLKALPTPAA